MMRYTARNRRRGVATVEAALVLPVIVVLVFGFVEIGYYVNCHHVLHDAARQGARAAVRQENSNAQVTAAVIEALSNSTNIDPESVTVRISNVDSAGVEQYQVMNLSENENGDPIRVMVTVNYDQFNSPSNYFGLASQSVASSVVMKRSN